MKMSGFAEIAVAVADAVRRSAGIASGVGVCAYVRGDTESEIERALDVTGLAVIVLPFEPVHSIPGTVPPFYDEAELIVHVVENPRVNLSGMDGAGLRDAVVLALAGSDMEGRLAEPLSEHRIARADDGDLTIREITWRTAAQLHE